ncbi:V-type sodium ATPase subunit G [bioreactor metagenome]|uniref:V-type sodium ATPase subunit G n=1 Tax=bioreactor metagenome TaxID=1076179 RepID=A0A645A1A5_9ZZZZ|nr:V-type ATP synthase subunit F [Oscillospiraceae bacterium]
MNKDIKKIAVIGDKESVLGFRAVGFDVRFCETTENAAAELDKMFISNEYAIIYITDILLAGLENDADKYSEKTIPALIPIPSKLGTNGYGVRMIKKSVERAVGADILFKDENNDSRGL